MQQENSRNTIIFVVCTVAILILYQVLVLAPAAKKRQAELKAHQVAEQQVQANAPGAAGGRAVVTRAQAMAGPRVKIDTPALQGSMSLTGARIDDLFLKQYRETLAKNSPPVELFRPLGSEHAYYAQFGFAGGPGMPNENAVWRVVSGDVLAPGKPVTLAFDSVSGLNFTRTVSVDDKYMFTVTDKVTNSTGAPVTVAPFGSVVRQGLPADMSRTPIIHEGAVGVFDKKLLHVKYKSWKKDGTSTHDSTGGWLGLTEKYWLGALVPDQHEKVRAQFRITSSGSTDIYEANYTGQPHVIAPGASLTESTRLFAGAKRLEVLQGYQKTFGIPRFDDAIDWGMFWFFTRPFFMALEWLYHLVGNFGVAILLLTVVAKAAFFPLANQSFASMTKMKKIQPKVEELKKKFSNDPAKQQQEMMALYQREKINPLAGCLPLLIQIPVFFALYKVLFVTIEMRHAPFFGWIQDLSARDPTSFINLFGLIPWNPATTPMIGTFLDGTLHVGVWPLLYGFTMFLTQQMSPASPDPAQQQIMRFFPIVFTVLLAQTPAGLVIYWVWSNLITILQQWVMMRRYGVDNPIDSFINRLRGVPKAAAG